MNLLAKKHTTRKVLLQFECLTWWEKLRTFSYFWVMIGHTFSFSHYITTLFISCCTVCYFTWWTRVSWGHHATLVYIEKMRTFERLCLRALKSLIWHWLSYDSRRFAAWDCWTQTSVAGNAATADSSKSRCEKRHLYHVKTEKKYCCQRVLYDLKKKHCW